MQVSSFQFTASLFFGAELISSLNSSLFYRFPAVYQMEKYLEYLLLKVLHPTSQDSFQKSLFALFMAGFIAGTFVGAIAPLCAASSQVISSSFQLTLKEVNLAKAADPNYAQIIDEFESQGIEVYAYVARIEVIVSFGGISNVITLIRKYFQR